MTASDSLLRMTEVKTYLPVSITYAELVRHGEWHDDAWVREMAKIVAEVRDVINSTTYNQADTLEELIDSYERNVREAESSLEYAQDDLNEANEKKVEAENKYEALRYDLDSNEQVKVINVLKAEVLEFRQQAGSANRRNHELTKEVGDLKTELARVREQLNMWTILNK